MNANLENEKAALEIQKLKNEVGPLGVFASHIWPMLATVLTILVSVIAVVVSLLTASRQTDFQQRQSEREQAQKHKEELFKAVELATDPNGKVDRRIAAIWELNRFWDIHSDTVSEEQVLIANVLAAELTPADENRFARCAAAEVIGNAEGPEAEKLGKQEAFAKTLSEILYGKSSGEIGLVVRQHLLLRSAQPGSRDPSGHLINPDPGASNRCLTALDATREAIRINWGYLRGVNLNETDLSRIQLYEADLAGTSLRGAYLGHANFRCANLSNADLSHANWEDADLHFAVVTNAKPKEFVEYAVSRGAYADLTDDQWLQWRKNKFLVKQKKPILEAFQGGQEGSRCGMDEIPPVELK